MDFAADVIAFPGGRVDEIDSSHLQFSTSLLEAHVDAWKRASIGENLSQARRDAGRLIAAAIREVSEECNIALEPEALTPWANWITPEGSPKRFDTYFLVSAVMPGVEPRHATTEASQSQWSPVQELLDGESAGNLRFLPPTLAILDDLLDLGATEPVFACQRTIEPVRLRPDGLEDFFRARRAREKTAPRPSINQNN
jgi:8-oxo-dGTP pyrophosphatase MutT (NUDIX family)